MKEFEVIITETLQKVVTVEALNKAEAEQMVEEMWNKGDVILDADHFVGADFTGDDGKEVAPRKEALIDVLMVEPGQYPHMEQIGSDLASLQKAVDGYIQAIYPFDDEVAIVCGEEAKLEGKPLNRALRGDDGEIYDIIAGKFFICGLGEEDFASLPKDLQKKFEDKFKRPETFLKMGQKIMAIPTDPVKATARTDKRSQGMEL